MGESRAFWTWFSVLCIAAALSGGAAVYATVGVKAPQVAKASPPARVAEMPQLPPPPRLVGPNVKLMTKGGHGSGVHIGKGFIITAAHVVGDSASMEVKFEDGSKGTAETLWVTKGDVALMRFKDEGKIGKAKLACREPIVGEPVTAFGNPMAFEDLTFRGFISGAGRDFMQLKRVFPSDLTVLPGMSGGALYDAKGEVIGINVMTALVPLGFMPSWARIGFSVSGKAICDLMARDA